jgi:hypothetical protein
MLGTDAYGSAYGCADCETETDGAPYSGAEPERDFNEEPIPNPNLEADQHGVRNSDSNSNFGEPNSHPAADEDSDRYCNLFLYESDCTTLRNSALELWPAYQGWLIEAW